MPRRVILDVDTGSDDAVAIMMAGLRPELELVACTTVWGNLDVASSTTNTLRVLDFIGRDDVPVYRGLSRPFAPIAFPPSEGSDKNRVHLHAKSVPLPASSREAEPGAVEWLVEFLRSATQRVTLVPVAPLTNIAAAVTADPRVVDAIDEVVLMGGGHTFGNSTASAEANIWHDPVAADVVFQAGFERLVVVPLDATQAAYFTEEDARRLAASGPIGVAAAGFVDHMRAGYELMQPMDPPRSTPVHDALCIAYLLDPSVLQLRACNAQVETTGRLTYGRTVFDLRGRSTAPTNAWVAFGADRERFVDLVAESVIPAAA